MSDQSDTQKVALKKGQNLKVILALAGLIALVAGAIFLGRSCDCNCSGAKSKTSKVSDGDLKKQVIELKKQVDTLQGIVDGYADCLEKICKKPTPPTRRNSSKKPPAPPTSSKTSPPSDGSGSPDQSECRVVRVVGNIVYTQGCQGWQALQYGGRKGDDRCPGIYYRGLGSNGAFSLDPQRMEENCRNFQLKRGSKWLVITPRSERRGANVCVSEPTPGEGLGYRPCNS